MDGVFSFRVVVVVGVMGKTREQWTVVDLREPAGNTSEVRYGTKLGGIRRNCERRSKAIPKHVMIRKYVIIHTTVGSTNWPSLVSTRTGLKETVSVVQK
jgi:hypothetical protein